MSIGPKIPVKQKPLLKGSTRRVYQNSSEIPSKFKKIIKNPNHLQRVLNSVRGRPLKGQFREFSVTNPKKRKNLNRTMTII